jgi:hypothetical protein
VAIQVFGREESAEVTLQPSPGSPSLIQSRKTESARQTAVVPRKEWNSLLQDFSRAHQGWLATLETADTVNRETVEAYEMSFQSIELNLEDKRNSRINVSVHRQQDFQTHSLSPLPHDPAHLGGRLSGID